MDGVDTTALLVRIPPFNAQSLDGHIQMKFFFCCKFFCLSYDEIRTMSWIEFIGYVQQVVPQLLHIVEFAHAHWNVFLKNYQPNFTYYCN